MSSVQLRTFVDQYNCIRHKQQCEIQAKTEELVADLELVASRCLDGMADLGAVQPSSQASL